MAAAIERRTYTTRDMQAKLGLGAHKIGRMAKSGELPAIWAGNRWLFPAARIDQLLGEHAPPSLERSEV